MKRTLISCIPILALLLAVSACDSGGSSDDDGNGNGNGNLGLGMYSGTVSGDVSRNLSGSAIGAGTSQQGGWGLALGGSTGDWISIATPTGTRPATGTHDILLYTEAGNATADDFIALITLDGSNVYYSSSGTFTVSSSSSSRVEGEFTFTGVSFAGGTVTVSGSFNASNLEN